MCIRDSCKTELTDTEWYLAQINKIYSDEIEVVYFATPAKSAENYIEQPIDERSEKNQKCTFPKTWIIQDGKMPVKEPSKFRFPAIQNCEYGEDDFQSRK